MFYLKDKSALLLLASSLSLGLFSLACNDDTKPRALTAKAGAPSEKEDDAEGTKSPTKPSKPGSTENQEPTKETEVPPIDKPIPTPTPIPEKMPTAPLYRVAFVGDQGANVNTDKVYQNVKTAKVDLMVILGDFDYSDDPAKWEKQLNANLGETFPAIAVVGNHDTGAWKGYRDRLVARLAKMKDIACTGDYGVNMECKVPAGITFVMSGVGTLGSGHEAFISKSLAESKTPWKVCNWHKNQTNMQTGDKANEVGWQAYEECRKAGAIVATGHEHSYERTHLLSSMEKQTIASKDNNLVLEPGKTFAFVSGLGGREVRDQNIGGDWWAKIYTSTQSATYGILICDFNIDNNPRKAHCQFKNVKDQIIDDFTMESKLP